MLFNFQEEKPLINRQINCKVLGRFIIRGGNSSSEINVGRCRASTPFMVWKFSRGSISKIQRFTQGL
ncbi:unnamed protein product [Musa acuminata var. zebrina]